MDFVLIDTDVLIDYSHGLQRAMDALIKLERKHRLAISVITQLELMMGCQNRREFSQLQEFIKLFHVIKLNELQSTEVVHLFESYRLSHGVSIPDMLIAATAKTIKVPLYSKNSKDFHFIRGLKFIPHN